MAEFYRQQNNMLFNGSTESFYSQDTYTSTDELQSRQEHYRGITFEEILPPQFISNAPPTGKQSKHRRPVQHPKSANADGPPAAVKRSYPSDSSKSRSRIRLGNTVRALVGNMTMVKRRDSQGYEAIGRTRGKIVPVDR